MSFELSRHAILTKIQNGEYFKDGRDWYITKHISIQTQAFIWLSIMLIALAAAYVSVKMVAIDHTTKEYPFPMFFDNSERYSPQIKGLAVGNESISKSVARYLTSDYVIIRESYNPLRISGPEWEKKLNKIRAISSRMIYGQYSNYMDPAYNADSPLMLYKTNVQRDITVDDVIFVSEEKIPSRAVVYFTATEKSREGSTESKWVADMEFSMSDAYNIIENHDDLQFFVTYYHVASLLQNN